jgi:hypothetical protein
VCQGDQGAVGQEVWCQLACRRRRGIWLRDQLRGTNAGNAIVFTSMQNAIKLKEEFGGSWHVVLGEGFGFE